MSIVSFGLGLVPGGGGATSIFQQIESVELVGNIEVELSPPIEVQMVEPIEVELAAPIEVEVV